MNYALALKGAPMGNKNAAGPHTGHAKAPIADHPYHLMDSPRLKYVIQDAGQAAKAMRGVSATAENKYMDQVNDASTVLYHRRTNALTDEQAIAAATAYQLKAKKQELGQVLKGAPMGNQNAAGPHQMKAALKDINSPDGLAWEANHGKGTAKIVGDEIHLIDTHAMRSNAERSAEDAKKNWSEGGAYHKYMKEERGIVVSHAGSEARDAEKPKAFAQYESVHRIKVHA